MKSSLPTLSVVIPAHNEQRNITRFHRELTDALGHLDDIAYEIIFVDDGSTDGTAAEIGKLAKKDPALRLVAFTRNFGKEIALTAGIASARGKAVVMVDADGQHPPALIQKLVKEWQGGAHMVIGVRKTNKKEGAVKKYGSKLYYAVSNIGKKDDQKIVPGSTDFRLIDESVKKEFLRLTEHNRITRGLLDWLGFQKAYVEFAAPARAGGNASYRFHKLAKLGVDSYISGGSTFLYTVGWMGLAIAVLAMFGGLAIVIQQWLLNDPLGWHITNSGMLTVGLFFFVGVALMSQGVTAFYVSHIYSEAQSRPLYVVDEGRSVRL